jgi:hypothetical protein
MLKAGVHPKVVSERPGHATVAFTLDTYSLTSSPGVTGSSCKGFDKMFLVKRENDTIEKWLLFTYNEYSYKKGFIPFTRYTNCLYEESTAVGRRSNLYS